MFMSVQGRIYLYMFMFVWVHKLTFVVIYIKICAVVFYLCIYYFLIASVTVYRLLILLVSKLACICHALCYCFTLLCKAWLKFQYFPLSSTHISWQYYMSYMCSYVMYNYTYLRLICIYIYIYIYFKEL